MDFDSTIIVSLLLFLIFVWVGNFIAKKRYKKRKRVQMIYTHYIKNFLVYGKNFTEQK